MFYIVFDFMMAFIMFLFLMLFYKSEGKATKFLSGYNMKSADERKKYDENATAMLKSNISYFQKPQSLRFVCHTHFQYFSQISVAFILKILYNHEQEQRIESP